VQDDLDNHARSSPPAVRAEGQRQLLRTGAYLHTSCPVCRGDLVENGWIRFKAIDAGGEEGELQLSPRFNVFDKKSNLPLQPGAELRDLLCPRCGISLVTPDRHCGKCGSKTVRIRIRVAVLEVGLYICTRIGCYWHGISEQDEKRLALEARDT
jgi:hypothetical protein